MEGTEGRYVVHNLHDAVLAEIDGKLAVVALAENAHESVSLLDAQLDAVRIAVVLGQRTLARGAPEGEGENRVIDAVLVGVQSERLLLGLGQGAKLLVQRV